MSDTRLITRLALRNYKSIAACDVPLGPLTFLVGPNGSGKSNFLDSLRFVRDSLRSTLDHSIRDRGGINEVRRRSTGHPNHFAVRLEFELGDSRGSFAFEIGAKAGGGYIVKREECHLISDTEHGRGSSYFEVAEGSVTRSTLDNPPSAAKDRLYLVNVSGIPQFRPLYDALSQMGFYNLNPAEIRKLQTPDQGELLGREGKNLASVLAHLEKVSPQDKERIQEYISQVVPGIEGVERRTVGPMETLEFRQTVRGAQHPWRFLASNMSDGTLRALGILVALFQNPSVNSRRHLVGIEEPELALHPAAAGVLRDALRDAAEHSQVLVTSHSPDLLDDRGITDESILAVVSERSETKVAGLDPTSREILKDQLFTAGELLRLDRLPPDPDGIPADPGQLNIFRQAS